MMAAATWIVRWVRKAVSKRPTFMFLHYLYIIFFTILGAVVIFIPGHVPFVDAIFFSSGSATQSGLNTIDLNKVNTLQQATTYVLPIITSTIFIHTVLVFVRIHFFERRFKNIVEEARRESQFQRTASQAARSRENVGVERGIVVLRAADGSTAHPHQPPELEESHEEDPVRPRPPTDATGSATTTATTTAATTTTTANPQSSSRIVWDSHVFSRTASDPQTAAEERAQHYDTSRSTAGATYRNSTDTIQEIPPTGAEPDGAEITRNESRRSRPLNRGPSLARTHSRLSFGRAATQSPTPTAPYLSWTPSVGRNSRFYDLTEEQRDELGGIEYRSLKTLSYILVGYYVVIHLLGVMVLVPWILRDSKHGKVVDDDAVGRVWWGVYTSMTCFGDVGYTLTPDSFISFQRATFVLVVCAILIVAGNTGFPLFLRFTIWVMFKLCPHRYPDKRDELNFLLDHPRRCFTLLFPSRPTWWLFWILVVLNLADVILFLVLDLQTPVINSIPIGHRIVNAFFQAVSTRTSGTASVPLASLHPGIQCSYLIMMYISALPLAISIRQTNVYEEHTLGVYVAPGSQEQGRDEASYIKSHIRRQLEFDLWYVFLGLFLICVAEGARIADASDYAFTAFGVFFEVVSAYGTVGLSLGYPDINTSLSGTFTPFSKLVIVAMEIRGRHRGLPYDVDRAVLLPNVLTPDSKFVGKGGEDGGKEE